MKKNFHLFDGPNSIEKLISDNFQAEKKLNTGKKKLVNMVHSFYT